MVVDLRKWPERRLKTLGCEQEEDNSCQYKRLAKLEQALYHDPFQLAILYKHHQPSHTFLDACINNLDVSNFMLALQHPNPLRVDDFIKELHDRLLGEMSHYKNFPTSAMLYSDDINQVRGAIKTMLIALIKKDSDLKGFKDDKDNSSAVHKLLRKYSKFAGLFSKEEMYAHFPKPVVDELYSEIELGGKALSAKPIGYSTKEEVVLGATSSDFLTAQEVMQIYKIAGRSQVGHTVMSCIAASVASGDDLHIKFIDAQKPGSNYSPDMNVIVVSTRNLKEFGSFPVIFIHEAMHYCMHKPIYKNQAKPFANVEKILGQHIMDKGLYDKHVDTDYHISMDLLEGGASSLPVAFNFMLTQCLALQTAMKFFFKEVAHLLHMPTSTVEKYETPKELSSILTSESYLPAFDLLSEDTCDGGPLAINYWHAETVCMHNASSCKALPENAHNGHIRQAIIDSINEFFPDLSAQENFVLQRAAYIILKHDWSEHVSTHAAREFVAVMAEGSLSGGYPGMEFGANFFNSYISPVINHDLLAGYRNATCCNESVPKISELLAGYTCIDQDKA